METQKVVGWKNEPAVLMIRRISQTKQVLRNKKYIKKSGKTGREGGTNCLEQKKGWAFAANCAQSFRKRANQ